MYICFFFILQDVEIFMVMYKIMESIKNVIILWWLYYFCIKEEGGIKLG